MNTNFSQNDQCDISQTDLKFDEPDFKEKHFWTCLHLPKSVYFIIITELCERFTYYGMRSILILYLTQHLLMQEGNAVSVYHFFVSLCYFTTIFGSFISDNYLGKFKTLIIIGAIYTIGATLLSLTSISSISLIGPLLSLTLIGFGTGGVKACVGPFGGDQISLHKTSVLASYFSMFYFAINLGGLLSTIVTPLLRAKVACNGSDDCYPLAFGVPALLMGVASVIFLAGRRRYIDVPIRGSIYIKAVRCILVAIKTWYRERRSNPRKHLLDYASNEYDETFIGDLRTLSRIAILFLPLPVYWALYEQIGSRWTLQAAQMDGEIADNVFILPDQMFIFNVVLVVTLIVIFDSCLFPLIKIVIPVLRPLRKMTVGIAFSVLAFFAAFFLQMYMENLQPPKIDGLQSRLVLANGQPCDTALSSSDGRTVQAGGYQTSELYLDLLAGPQQILLNVSKCGTMQGSISINTSISLTPGKKNFLVIEVDPRNNITMRIISDSHDPNIKGYPVTKVTLSSTTLGRHTFQLTQASTSGAERTFTVTMNQSLYTSDWTTLSKPGRYTWNVINNNSTITPFNILTSINRNVQVNQIKIVSSAVIIFHMVYSSSNGSIVAMPLSVHGGSQVSILWQLPQYLLISIGEVLVNVPGLTFSYDQAPVGMKSLVNALWYMCDAFGNIIVIIVAKIQLFERQSWEYLTFAIICIVFNVIFGVLAHCYPMVQKEQYVRMT